MFPAPQLQAIARQSKVERLRRWNECLLCCFTVEEAEQSPKRHREQFVNKAGVKSRRTSFAMKHARADRADDHASDESDQPLGVAGLTLTDDDTEAMARHVAAHLQVLMLLTIRLVGIYGDDGHETQDDANSASVDVGDSDDGFLTRSKSELLGGIGPAEEVDMLDADDGAPEAADVAQDDLVIPDAVVDFDGVPRRHDELLPEEDGFLQELINSGAYQAHLQTPHPENKQSQSRPSTPLAEDDSGEEYDWRPNPDRSAELLENLKPSFEGFKEHLLNAIPQLGASIDHYLVGRIAQQQVTRYTHLEGLQVKHLQAVAAGNCASGTLCDAFKGTRNEPEKRLDVPSANHGDSDSGEDDSSLEEAITAEQFPRDIPLPRTKSLPARFECHLCFSTVKIRKPSDWTKHVYEDIQPFTCTWEGCKNPRMFKRKVDWARHENEAHRRLEWWTCDVEDCGHIVYRRDNFLQHLVREHKLPEPKLKMRAAIRVTNIDPTWARVDQCHHESRAVPQDEPCRFCGKAFSSWKRLTVHLAKHMEYISLQALKLVLKEAARLDKDAIIDAAQKRPLIPPTNYGPFLQTVSETFPGPFPDSSPGPFSDSYPAAFPEPSPEPFPEPSSEPFPDYYPDPFI
ncbi:hypothetical protein NEMBOFW57_009063 [Staphylotrichum longicolle]|uniref:C2H2-type domain-containing protein n=1 Tax=Staphylotrichum longicolle TaxID=669026 RepID=A0AAD4ESZ2_9PEZI|nr:hypothetical protein NEMBOFW57_009063 [Staphylotrichum longicolle]